MKVSVIVPIYNLQSYVAECIESLVSQVTDFEFEVIAVDDSSKDESYEVLKKLRDRHPLLLKIYRNDKNLGLARTMRRLVSLASGEYVAYLDGDDVALPGKLQIQSDYLDKHKSCSIAYHESEVFDSDTGRTLKKYSADYYNWRYVPLVADVTHVIRYGCFMQASAVMVRRHSNMLEAVDLENEILHDHPWHVLNLIYGGGTIDFIDQTLGRYRIHSESFGAQTLRSPERRENVLLDQLHVCDLAERNGVDNVVVREGRWHYYFATALYFLRLQDYERYLKYMKLSSNGEWFFDQRHEHMWKGQSSPEALKERYFSKS